MYRHAARVRSLGLFSRQDFFQENAFDAAVIDPASETFNDLQRVRNFLNLMISTKIPSSPRLEADCLSYALSQVSTISFR